MKNFTNNFKQFTSRLSARWLIMALMLLLGTSSAWAFDGSGTIYFDNTATNWSTPYLWLGKSSWSDATYKMTRVSGTQNLYSYTLNNSWSDATNIAFRVSSWGGEGNSICHRAAYTNNGDMTFIYGSNTSGVKENYIYTPTSTLSANSSCGNKTAYEWGNSVTKSNYTVTINSATGGTLTVNDYDNNAVNNDASKIYLTVLKFTASASAGYTFEEVQINNGSSTTTISAANLASQTYTITSNVTITPVWEKTCTTPAAPTLNPNSTTVCSGTSFDLPSGYRWYTVDEGGTILTSNTISNGVTEQTKYYAEAGEDGCVSTSRTAYTVNVDPKSDLELENPTICQGSSIVLSDYVEFSTGTVKWYSNSGRTTEITNPSVARTPQSNPTYYYARATSGVCSSVDKTLTVTLSPQPAITLKAAPTICEGTTITFENYVNTSSGTVTWHTKSDYSDAAIATATPSQTTTYYAKATSGNCDPETVSLKVTVKPRPKSSDFNFTIADVNYDGDSHPVTVTWKNGGGNSGITVLYNGNTTAPINAGIYTVTVTTVENNTYCETQSAVELGSFKITCKTPAKPSLSSTAITACNGECTAQGYITINNMNDYKDDTYTFELGSSVVTPDANGRLGINSTAYTQYTVTVTNSCGNQNSANVEIAINDKTPTISGKTITQPGKDNAIELTLPTGISANWSVEPNNADLSVNVGNSTLFSAEEENDYVITANNDGCIDTHNVKVSTAFLIWVRRPMSDQSSYENIYSGTSEKGGALYLEQTTSGQTYTSVDNVANRNSSTHNKIEPESSYTDCEGATWDIFRTTPEMALAGAKFYVAAKNDVKTNGYATYTKDYTFANGMTADAYFTIGGHASGNKGSEIVLSEQPLPTNVYSSGDAKFNANNFADFVPLYVVDCSGNEVDSYQWQFSATIDGAYTNYSSECSYVGKNTETTDAGKSNNIRVKEDGYYRCIVTYKDGKGTSTSNSIKVTNTTSGTPATLSFTSELPIIMVNTNDIGFPVNNFGGTPSKNADKMKEKMSVDVKIYEGSTLKYDRKARMNYRGSSSLNFLKKSYAFCPGKADCVEDKGRKDYVKTEKLNMLGIGEAVDKDWVLYAAAADPSLMRNRLMFDTFADMTGGWSVQSRYVELIVDGEYKGVYVMMDKITVNEKRVNIEWKLDKSGNTTQEAFIVKFDKTDVADRYEITSGDQKTFKSKYSGHDGFDTYDTNIDQRFEVEYPEKEDIEDGKGKWSEVFNAIENKINKFEEELAKGNFSEVQKLIDYTSWADWFILTEFAKNIDGYRASNIFVYDGSKANAKIEARPLWDQELSFNNQCPSYYDSYGSSNTSGLLIDKNNSAVYDNDASAPFWFTGKYKGDRGKYNGSGQTFKGLLDDPCFQAEVQARWAIHTGAGGALTSDKMVNMMKGYLADLDKDHVLNSSTIHAGTPLDREFNTFWKNKSRATIDCGTGSGCYAGSTGYTDTGFHNSKVSLNNWLTGSRRTNLGNIINGWEGTELNITLTITPATGITTPWEAVMVQVNNPSGYDYDLEYTTNTLDKVSGVIINENNDKYTYRIPRPEAWKPGDEEKDGERTDIQYGIKATLKVGEGIAQCGNSSQAPSATTTITLQDEANENCPK